MLSVCVGDGDGDGDALSIPTFALPVQRCVAEAVMAIGERRVIRMDRRHDGRTVPKNDGRMRNLARQILHRTILATGFKLSRVKPFEQAIRRFQLDHDDFYFVQVGAYNGVTSDPLCPFIIESGTWSGVMIEPQKTYFDVLQEIYRDRENISVRNVAVGMKDGNAKLYRIKEGAEGVPYWAPQLASFRYEVIAGHRDRIPNIEALIESVQVPCLTLATIVRQANLKRLDLLVTDVEGADYTIIRQIDDLDSKPRFIHFEDRHLSESDRRECMQFLTERHYNVRSIDDGESFATLT